MKSQDCTASPSAPWLLSRNVLSEAGIVGSLSLVGPGVELPPKEHTKGKHVVLFVADGNVTVNVGPTHFILLKDEALRVAPGKGYGVRNHTDSAAKVFILETPVPQTATAPVFADPA